MKICDYKIGYSFENRLRKEFRKINVELQIICDIFDIMKKYA